MSTPHGIPEVPAPVLAELDEWLADYNDVPVEQYRLAFTVDHIKEFLWRLASKGLFHTITLREPATVKRVKPKPFSFTHNGVSFELEGIEGEASHTIRLTRTKGDKHVDEFLSTRDLAARLNRK